MATKPDSKPHYATRDFTDAGTTRRFERGTEIKDATEGEIGNYVAARLATTERPKADAPDPATPPA